MYHITADGVVNAGVFKPWYDLSRKKNYLNLYIRSVAFDAKNARLYFLAGDYLFPAYHISRLYYLDFNNLAAKPKLVFKGKIGEVNLVKDRLYFCIMLMNQLSFIISI